MLRVSDAVPRVVLLGRLALFGQSAERLHEEIIAVAARWIEPTQRNGPLAPYGRDGEERALGLLEEALRRERHAEASVVVQQRLAQSAASDVADLAPHLNRRAAEAAEKAIALLRQRGEREAADLRAAIEQQARRVSEQLEQNRTALQQLTLDFNLEERRQMQLDQRVWAERLAAFERDLASEPQRVREFYEVRAQRSNR